MRHGRIRAVAAQIFGGGGKPYSFAEMAAWAVMANERYLGR